MEKRKVCFLLKINPAWDDEEIWHYAKENGFIIVTKDKDFLVKQAVAGSPPKVIHIKLGNLKRQAFVEKPQRFGRTPNAWFNRIQP